MFRRTSSKEHQAMLMPCDCLCKFLQNPEEESFAVVLEEQKAQLIQEAKELLGDCAFHFYAHQSKVGINFTLEKFKKLERCNALWKILTQDQQDTISQEAEDLAFI
jgi:hypothetical protein